MKNRYKGTFTFSENQYFTYENNVDGLPQIEDFGESGSIHKMNEKINPQRFADFWAIS